MEYDRLSSVNKIIHKKSPSEWDASWNFCSKASKAIPSWQARKGRRHVLPELHCCIIFIDLFVFTALQQSTSVDTKSKVDKNVNKQVDANKVYFDG